MKTNRQLRMAIRAALDCPSHIDKPTVINNDPYFSFGTDDPLVLCNQCILRLREAIGLKPGDDVPTYYQMFEKRSSVVVDLKLEDVK